MLCAREGLQGHAKIVLLCQHYAKQPARTAMPFGIVLSLMHNEPHGFFENVQRPLLVKHENKPYTVTQ